MKKISTVFLISLTAALCAKDCPPNRLELTPMISEEPPYRGQCNSNPVAVLPDIREVLHLCNQEKYDEAANLLTDMTNTWTIEKKLSDDQYIALHFLNAYLDEKRGFSNRATFHMARVYLFQLSHHHKPETHDCCIDDESQ